MITTIITTEQFVGNGSTITPYVLPFRILNSAHLRVSVADAAGGVTELDNGSDFSVDGAGDNSFSFTTTDEWGPEFVLTATVRMPIVQETNFTNGGRLDAEVLERRFDYLTLLIQLLADGNGFNGDRAVLFPASDPRSQNTYLPVAPLRKDSFIYFDPDAGEMTTVTRAQLVAMMISALGFDSDIFARRSGGNTFTGPQHFESGRVSFGVLTLTDAASIAWDLAAGNMATVTLGGNRTLANPVNIAPGTYLLRVVQDATGGHGLAFGDAFRFPGGTPPVLTSEADATDVLTFVSFGDGLLHLVAQYDFAPA